MIEVTFVKTAWVTIGFIAGLIAGRYSRKRKYRWVQDTSKGSKLFDGHVVIDGKLTERGKKEFKKQWEGRFLKDD